MFGIKITHVFRSRWHALLWSAGILMTAYCSIPTPDPQPDADAVPDKAQMAQAHSAADAWSDANGGGSGE